MGNALDATLSKELLLLPVALLANDARGGAPLGRHLTSGWMWSTGRNQVKAKDTA